VANGRDDPRHEAGTEHATTPRTHAPAETETQARGEWLEDPVYAVKAASGVAGRKDTEDRINRHRSSLSR
jgi:hypothetical protein